MRGGRRQALGVGAGDDAARLGPRQRVVVAIEVLLGLGTAAADGVGVVEGELAAAVNPSDSRAAIV